MARPDILKQVRVRIEDAAPGDIFIPADFSDLAEARKITMCLSRLHGDGTLEKVKRGVYMKPRYSQLLNRSVGESDRKKLWMDYRPLRRYGSEHVGAFDTDSGRLALCE